MYEVMYFRSEYLQMKLLLFTSILILSMNSFAFIESGTWKGKVSESANCFMDVGVTSYEGSTNNPLNESTQITVGATVYSAKHPYQINTNDGSITVDLESYESVVATPTGAFALKIQVKKTGNTDFPISLSVMEDDWASHFREIVSCSNFVKVAD